jgi:ABC-type nitrate/sulfonate/bicarbonate transport system permease component
MNWRRDVAPPVVLIVILVVGWFFVARVSGLSSFILPSPMDVIQAGWDTRALLLNAIGLTLLATGIGLVLAIIAGVGIAAIIDFWPLAHRALYPILVVSQTIQILAIAPILIIWFGFGLTPTIVIVVLFCFFPLAISTADGLISSDPDLIALLRAMGASKWQIWRIVRMPSALPSFFSGLRLAVTYSVVAATIGEWVGGSQGLGLYMLKSKNALATISIRRNVHYLTIKHGLFMVVYGVERIVLPLVHSDNAKSSGRISESINLRQ